VFPDNRMKTGALKDERSGPARACKNIYMQTLLLNIRLSVRALRRSPGFAFTAILTLALGIGAVTSVFGLVDTILLKPFSFPDGKRLVVVREIENEAGNGSLVVPDNYRHYLRLKKDTKTIEDAAIFHRVGISVSPNGDRPHIVGAIAASPNFFRVLEMYPILGRSFVQKDAEKGANTVVLLSYAGWQTLLKGDPNVIGQTLRIGGQPATVIGVLPPAMHFPEVRPSPAVPLRVTSESRDVMIYVPFQPSERDLTVDDEGYNYNVIARLKSNVTLGQARAELTGLQRAYTLSAHLPIPLGISLTPFGKDVTSSINGALWLMFAAVGGVLLIACVNLANLQLARAVAAERETAVRAALGASKGQLLMTRLSESLVLAVLGGATGVMLAITGVRFLIALVPANVPRLNEVQVNLPVLLFAAGTSLAVAMLFGILPALRSIRVNPQTALQANSARAANTREGRRTRNLLVAAEVACTLVLLIITSLVLRSFSHLLRQDRGFDSSHITLAQVDLFAPQYDDTRPNVKAAKLAFADRALAALEHLPGVQSVAMSSAIPLTGQIWIDNLTRPDHPLPKGQQPSINVRWINPDFLATLQIPLIAGRNLTTADRANPYVMLISERAAREGFPGENPIGRQIDSVVPDDQHRITVIGVVADTRINDLKDTAAMAYLPYWAYTPWTITFLVRSGQTSDALIPELRRVLWGIDPQVAIPLLKSMDEQVIDSVASDRFQAIVLTFFVTAALLLALLGVYGVLEYTVSLRHRELGIRIALGSGKAALTELVLRQAAYPVLLGAGVGLVLTFVGLHWVRSLLYHTAVLDPLAIGGSLLLLLVAAALAAVLPARRAASVDPIEALRNE
jgi:predicted permease